MKSRKGTKLGANPLGRSGSPCRKQSIIDAQLRGEMVRAGEGHKLKTPNRKEPHGDASPSA